MPERAYRSARSSGLTEQDTTRTGSSTSAEQQLDTALMGALFVAAHTLRVNAAGVEPSAATRPARRARTVVMGGVIAGLLLGALDFLAQTTLPYPWADLANSSAVWALAAFAIGCWITPDSRRAAMCAATMLVTAVESYNLTAVVGQGDSLANVASPSTAVWLLFGLAGGAIFGAAGSWSRGPVVWLASSGSALAGAVLWAEALVRLHAESSQYHHGAPIVLIEAAFGVTVIMVAGRTRRQRTLGVAISFPLTALGFLTFTAFGFGM